MAGTTALTHLRQKRPRTRARGKRSQRITKLGKVVVFAMQWNSVPGDKGAKEGSVPDQAGTVQGVVYNDVEVGHWLRAVD